MLRSFVERAVVVWAILAAALIGLGAVWGGWLLLEKSASVLVMLLLGALLALILNPIVERLTAWMPRWAAVLLVYVAIVGVLATLAILIVPLLVTQGRGFALWIKDPQNPVLVRANEYINWYQAQAPPDVKNAVKLVLEQVRGSSQGVVHGIVGSIVTALTWPLRGVIVLVISIYLLLDKDNFVEWFHRVTADTDRIRLERLFNDVVGVLGGYIRGLAMMVLFVATTVSVALLVGHIKYWLFIGCMAGILEIIPYFGAVAGAVPALILGFERSTATGIGLIIAFIVINQVEGHAVAPLAMGKTMHMRPLAVLLALLIGAEIKGVMGMILAVPVLGIIRVLFTHAWRIFHEPMPPNGQTLMEAAGEAMEPRSEEVAPNGQLSG